MRLRLAWQEWAASREQRAGVAACGVPPDVVPREAIALFR
jgi:hypothetical protein